MRVMIEMEVVAVQPEPNSNRPLVWLKDKDQRIFLPIAIGNFEATAIYMALYNEPPPRPISHDLLRSVLDGFDVQVEGIVINSLKQETFYAEIKLASNSGARKIDSRPSDAIALALRVGAPIFVDEEVIQEAGLVVERETDQQSEHEEVDGFILDLIQEAEEFQDPEATEILDIVDQDEQRVVALKARLKEAVESEEYEEAAKLRDEIGRLEHEQG